MGAAAIGRIEATAGQSRRRRVGGAAVALSLLAHLVVLGLLMTFRPSSPPVMSDEHSISLDLMKPWPRNRPRPPPPRIRERATVAPSAPLARPIILPQTAPTPLAAAPPVAPSQAPAPDARLGAVLRRSVIGCAYADTALLSEARKEACRQWLARGAQTAPYISDVPPNKRAYYEALTASEDAMRRDPMGGRHPGVTCGKAVGLKIPGLPCFITPPQSPWTPEAGVPGP